VQPILFHEKSVSWTEIAVQHILMSIMTPQPIPAKTARAPLGTLLPNPKARLKVVLTTFLPVMLRWKPETSAVFLGTVIRVLNKVKGRGAGSAGAPAPFTVF